MNFSAEVAWPRAQAAIRVSGSYRLNDIRTDSIPDSSAARAKRTQPSMSGSAAGDRLLVVKTRHVSWAVVMATSPPLGSIQWNLRFMGSDLSGAHLEARPGSWE